MLKVLYNLWEKKKIIGEFFFYLRRYHHYSASPVDYLSPVFTTWMLPKTTTWKPVLTQKATVHRWGDPTSGQNRSWGCKEVLPAAWGAVEADRGEEWGWSDSWGSGDNIRNTQLPLTQLGILQALPHFYLPRIFQVVLINPHMQMTKTGLEGLDN